MCTVSCRHNPAILSSCMICHLTFNISNTTNTTAYPCPVYKCSIVICVIVFCGPFLFGFLFYWEGVFLFLFCLFFLYCFWYPPLLPSDIFLSQLTFLLCLYRYENCYWYSIKSQEFSKMLKFLLLFLRYVTCIAHNVLCLSQLVRAY